MRESTQPQRPTVTSVTIPAKKVTAPLKVVPAVEATIDDDEDDRVICRGID
jgi:hypothetical protein